MNHIQKFILSVAYVGLIPFAPGTWGSLITLPILYWLQTKNINLIALTSALGGLTILATFITDSWQKQKKIIDPSWIVIDEVLGMALAWVILKPLSLWGFIGIFIIFRCFDIFKPGPIGIADKKIKNGFGVIFDDLLAGAATAITWIILTKSYYALFA